MEIKRAIHQSPPVFIKGGTKNQFHKMTYYENEIKILEDSFEKYNEYLNQWDLINIYDVLIQSKDYIQQEFDFIEQEMIIEVIDDIPF